MNSQTDSKTVRGCYTFGPSIRYSGSSFDAITDFISDYKETGPRILFTSDIMEDQDDMLTKVTRHLASSKEGFVVFSRSFPDLLGLHSDEPSHDFVCDILIVGKTAVPCILTISKSNKDERYNLRLAKSLLRRLRHVTTEDFTLSFGRLEPEDADYSETFERRLKIIRQNTTRFALRKYLYMNQAKCYAIALGFLTLVGMSEAENSDAGSDDSEGQEIVIKVNKTDLETILNSWPD